MNVVHVVESLAVGGLERVVLSLAAWQNRRGDASQIVCLFEAGALATEARAQGIVVTVIGKSPGFDLRALLCLRAALRTSGADVLHTHNAVAHYYAVAAAVGLGIKYVVNTRHGMGSFRGASRLDWMYRAAMLRTDTAVSVCRAGREHFVRVGVIPHAKAEVVPNGVPIEGIEARSHQAKEQLLSRLGRPSASFVVGTVGRLSPVKDHATLLKAIHQLRVSGRPVELLVVGDGESRALLEALSKVLELEECVHFLGMRDDVAALLPTFDAFALSSISEGYSLALVEAAAAALPIVATRVGGNSDIVEEGATGLLVPAHDASAFAAALAGVVDDASMRERMGRAGRQWALEHGTVGAMGLAYLALYKGPSTSGGEMRHASQAPTAPAGKA